MNATSTLRGLWAVLVLLYAAPVWSQTGPQFTSRIFQPAQHTTPYGQTSVAQVPAPSASLQGTIQPAPTAWDPYATPGISSSAGYAPQPYAAGGAYAPGAYAPGAYGAAPSNAYYNPGMTTPNAVYPQGAPSLFPPGYPQQGGLLNEALRLVQEFRVQHTWLYGDGSEGDLDVNTLETSVTMAFPFFYQQTPLLVSPGFAVHWWEGPVDPVADLPPRTYDVFVDFAWNPNLTERFALELGFRPGLYTDFQHTGTDSIRYMGRALGVITFTPQTQVKFGAIYLDRLKTKVLPAGGVIYTPNADTRWEIFFPRPKLAHRLTTVGNTGVWGFLAGEYGGGSWTIERDDGSSDRFDYNDIRVSLGLEFIPETLSGRRGLIEAGYVFNRELIYESGIPPEYEPDNTFMIRAGMSF